MYTLSASHMRNCCSLSFLLSAQHSVCVQGNTPVSTWDPIWSLFFYLPHPLRSIHSQGFHQLHFPPSTRTTTQKMYLDVIIKRRPRVNCEGAVAECQWWRRQEVGEEGSGKEERRQPKRTNERTLACRFLPIFIYAFLPWARYSSSIFCDLIPDNLLYRIE